MKVRWFDAIVAAVALAVAVVLAAAGVAHASCDDPYLGTNTPCITITGASSQFGKLVVNFALGNSVPSGYKVVLFVNHGLPNACGTSDANWKYECGCGTYGVGCGTAKLYGQSCLESAYVIWTQYLATETLNRGATSGAFLVNLSDIGGADSGDVLIELMDSTCSTLKDWDGIVDYAPFSGDRLAGGARTKPTSLPGLQLPKK